MIYLCYDSGWENKHYLLKMQLSSPIFLAVIHDNMSFECVDLLVITLNASDDCLANSWSVWHFCLDLIEWKSFQLSTKNVISSPPIPHFLAATGGMTIDEILSQCVGYGTITLKTSDDLIHFWSVWHFDLDLLLFIDDNNTLF